MNIKYQINYSGFIPVPRGILLLLKTGTISIHQLGFYLLFVMQADFDPKHGYYRAVIRDDKQLAKLSSIASTTVYRHRKELIEAGVLVEQNGVTKVTNFKVFELDWIKRNLKLPVADLEELFVTPQEAFTEDESDIASLKPERD